MNVDLLTRALRVYTLTHPEEKETTVKQFAEWFLGHSHHARSVRDNCEACGMSWEDHKKSTPIAERIKELPAREWTNSSPDPVLRLPAGQLVSHSYCKCINTALSTVDQAQARAMLVDAHGRCTKCLRLRVLP